MTRFVPAAATARVILSIGIGAVLLAAAQISGRAESIELGSVSARGCTATASPGDNLQAAIDQAAAQRPAVLCLAKGDYPLNDYLAIRSNDFTLRGSGHETVLRLEHEVPSPVIVVGDDGERQPRQPIRNVVIENLAIIGGGHGGSEYHGTRPWLTNSGVVVRWGQSITVRGLDVGHCRSAGILTEYDSRDVTIERNRVRWSAWDGVSLNRAGPTTVRDNELSENVAAGLTTEYMEGSTIEANRFVANGSHGIYLADAYHNRIAGNRFERNVGAGVFLACSIRTRDPVLCWDNSMSRGNELDGNTYVDNGNGYLLGVDAAANCTADGFEPNVSHDEIFRNSPNSEPDWATFGNCLRYDGSRSE